jgi:putative endonuclease
MISSLKFTVYAIKSNNRNYIYVGMTNNLERRLKEHNQHENKSTKAYAPSHSFTPKHLIQDQVLD